MPALSLAVLFLAVVVEVHAAKAEFERTKPHVNIATIGHVELRDPPISFDFLADIQFGPAPSASGVMQVALGDGSVRFYAPVAGTLLEGHECLVFFLGGRSSGELDPTDPAIAIVREDPERRGVIVVKLQLTRVFPQTLEFEVPGEIRLIPGSNERPQPRAHPWFSFYYPPQKVIIHGTDMVLGFFASADVRRDHSAKGHLALGLPDGEPPIFFEPLFGTVVPETGPGYIIILMALDGAPLRIENLAVGTVHPDPHLPGCDIWDFASNGVSRNGSPLHLVFDAEGETRFARERESRDSAPSHSR
jgi:hypothetical protein